MTSDRKIAANRRNSRNSSGPRSAAGKLIASRNALRHGLAALVHRQSAPSEEIDQMARKLCGGDKDQVVFAQAMEIAKNDMILRAVRAQKIAVIERMREPYVAPLCKKDNSLDLARARSMEGWLAYRELQSRLPEILEKYKDKMQRENPPSQSAEGPSDQSDGTTEVADVVLGFIPLRLQLLLVEPETIDQRDRDLDRARQAIGEPNEYEALEAAILDLVRLDRYERRAWSARKRAVREFVKLLRQRHAVSSAAQNKAA